MSRRDVQICVQKLFFLYRIFRLLKALGIALDGPLKSNDMDNLFYSLNAYVAQPLLNLVQSMDSE